MLLQQVVGISEEVPFHHSVWISGYLSTADVPFSSSCISLVLLIFLGKPYAFAKDQGNGPRGYLKTSFKSIFRNCPVSAIRVHRLRSILRRMSF